MIVLGWATGNSVCAAWLELAENVKMVKKSFLVMGISNALGGYEDHLVRNDDLKKEMDSILESIFGTDPLDGMESDEEPDPLATDSESDEEPDPLTAGSESDSSATSSDSDSSATSSDSDSEA